MSHSAGHVEEQHGGTRRLYYSVWAWLLALTIVELILAYIQLAPGIMLTLLMGLSIIKAALIIAYFMHLRFEPARLAWTLIPAVITCILLMFASFPETFRVVELGTKTANEAAKPAEGHH